MPRAALLYVLPAVLVASTWLQAERSRQGADAFWIVLLALAGLLVRPRWAQIVAATVATVAAASIAFGASPVDARPFDGDRDFFGPLLSGFGDGFLAYWDVALPFAPAEHPNMHGIVLVAIFAFCFAIAAALAARRPLVAVAATFAGVAWPATLVPGGNELVRGAVVLGACLLLLAGWRVRPVRSYGHAALAGAALVVAGLAASSSPAVAKDAFLSWKQWDAYTKPDDPVGVEYAWTSNYAGIEFPEDETTVLKVRGPRRPLYWRATTLDGFFGDIWGERPRQLDGPYGGFVDLSDDAMLPAAAAERARWVRADVRVEALRDRHLVGPAVPVAYEASNVGVFHTGRDGVAVVRGGLRRGRGYTVWAYAPQPKPARLAESKARYPRSLTGVTGYLGLGSSTSAPVFGSSDRDAVLREAFASDPAVAAYRPLYRTARGVVGRPRSPYAAAVALESWFRGGSRFTYDEQPGRTRGRPPLVAFVTTHRRGYCQHFAGAMALMLRYLGIPARVAAGFTSGTYDAKKRTWTVTDHDAHTWVEAWFEGWGWLSFDPTPGRGRLAAAYSSASPRFDALGAADLLERLGARRDVLAPQAAAQSRRLGEELRVDRRRESGRGAPNSELASRGGSLLGLLALVGAVAMAAVAAAKTLRRRVRFATRDPRRLAAACRAELADFALDQRLAIARSATIVELGTAVERELGVDADRFVRAAGAARYGPARDASAEARRARRELKALRGRLRRRLGVAARLRGLVSVRSLGLGA